ncbi:MAG: hypothetical protein JWO15_3158 [Sphingomonadales bacterium]|nr:hypothetical protein [Sphingomonadales bacterium]
MINMMKHSALGCCAVMALHAASPASAAGLRVTNTILVQQRVAVADGTTRVTLVPANHVVPGDRVVFRIAYHNEVGQPINGVVLNTPVPANLAYRGPAEGSPVPEVSVDGKSFGPLATLKVIGAQGHWRAAQAQDVTHVRWVRSGAVPVNGAGQYAFEAVLK